jgi:hypothetical protein
MLNLRGIYISDQWQANQEYRIERTALRLAEEASGVPS